MNLDYFKTFCDINDFPCDDNYLATAQSLINKDYSQMISYHKLGFMFQGLLDLIDGAITLEDYFLLGDVDSIHPIFEDHGLYETLYEILEGFRSQSPRFKNTLIIVDKISYEYFVKRHNKEFKEILSLAEKYKSKIVAL